MIIQAHEVYKKIATHPLFEGVSCQVNPSERIGLVGINGSGKSTLLHLLAGQESLDGGTISCKKGLKVGLVEQDLVQTKTTVENYLLASAVTLQELKQQLHFYEAQMTDPSVNLDKCLAQYGIIQQTFEEQGGYILEDRLAIILKGLGLYDKQHTPLEKLSGGEQMKVALAKTLLTENDLLLLDEPTNHLDITSIRWLEQFILSGNQSVIVVSHDRAFLDRVTSITWELEDGSLQTFTGNYSRYRTLKIAQEQALQKDYAIQQKEIKRLKAIIKRYRQWGTEGDNESFFKKAKEIEKRLEKLTLVKPPVVIKKRLKAITESNLSGKEVFLVKDFEHCIGDRRLFGSNDFKIYRGERVAILGENGSGKSTLLKLLIGEVLPTKGIVKQGSNLQIGYLPQQLSFPNLNQRLLAYTIALTGHEETARRLLAQSGFFQSDVAKRIANLSGGEKIRLYLMTLFLKKINVLILDEPTNHLDIYAREEIEEMIRNFDGTLIAVSHDRYFLARHFDTALIINHQQVQRTSDLHLI